MINKNSCLVLALVQVLIGAQIFLPLAAVAGISNLPPLVKANVPPNVFYTLDDSGSMTFEVVPDNFPPTGKPSTDGSRDDIFSYFGGWVTHVFPAPDNVYNVSGAGDYGSANTTVVGFSDNITVARWRSAITNKMYYDPAIRYLPWINKDSFTPSNHYGTPMPNAVPTAALFNPVIVSGMVTTTINLTVEQPRQPFSGVSISWLKDSADDATEKPTWTVFGATKTTFYPATYFQYNPSNLGSCTTTQLDCFQRIEIKPGTDFGAKAAARTDCTDAKCNYTQEIQNFANWFQYYRSRILTARAGSGKAFANQAPTLRVGFGTINTSGTKIRNISDDFNDASKSSFLDTLYTTKIPAAGTPLRKAVDQIGQYFMDSSTTGPWQTVRGSGSENDQLSCRQNYNILMTDGYWNGTAAGSARSGDWDAKDGATMTRPDDTTFKYVASNPYKQAQGDNLADIAMYYWVTDLRPDWGKLKKNVPTPKGGVDPAFWQHLVQYTVGLGVSPTLNPATDLPLLTSGVKDWPDATTNQIDDLWHAAVNSRGKFFSAANPQAFSDALNDSLNEIADRSGDAAAIATSKNTLDIGLKLYTSTYKTGDWSGRLEQKPLNASTGNVESENDWSTDGKVITPSSRTVVTSNTNGQGGVNFSFSTLSGAHQTIMTSAAAAYAPASIVTGTDIVNYIRGEQDTTKPFRKRQQLLGDLVNSDPQYVKEGKDGGYIFMPSYITGKTSYRAFLATKLGRVPTVYVGSNDGMLHAFDGTSATDVNPSTTGGNERFAYIPQAVIPNLPELAKPNYVHRFYVDGTPMIADAAIGGEPYPWRTVLVGATGAGGKSVFALDVTDPLAFSSSKVLWELNSTTPSVDNDLGYTIGTPQIGLLKDGRWVAIFGNGYGSTNSTAKLYVVNLATGAVLYRLDTGVGSVSVPNGLSTPKLRLAADSTIEAVYAGDIQGNLWKFNFITTGTVPTLVTTPSVAFASQPLFSAVNTSRKQPITTQPQVYPHPNDGFMVLFGTGKIYEDSDPSSTSFESLYGIWDKATPSRVGQTDLVEQTLSTPLTGFYAVSNNPVSWTSKRGWYITLRITGGERIVNDPIVFEDQIIFTTLIPGSSTDPCSIDGKSTTLQISPFNGAPLGYKTIDTNGVDGVTSADAMVSGRQSNATFGTTIVRLGNRKVKIFQADSKNGTILGGNAGVTGQLSAAIPSVRLWRQIIGKQ